MELDLVEQVPEFLDEVLVGAGVVLVECLDGIHGLVGLLDEVLDERAMGLLPIPGTLLAQRAGELVEPHECGAHWSGQFGDEERSEVVCLEGPVDVRPGNLEDLLIGQTEVVQQDGARRHLVLEGELDVREHPVGVGMGDKERAGLPGCADSERMTVDEAKTGLDGIDTETRVRNVEERHRRKEFDVDRRVIENKADRAFEHQR
ncbi:unannotated protein [freshwater metagenome]|uniref:Unannotated protein n=1 Tax=freshwater metagenome TaxID=449393 RepID=A0A6J7EPI9_9ZZZZ